MDIKILGMCMSTRRGGPEKTCNDEILIKEVLSSAREYDKDVETDYFHIADYKFDGGCRACRLCYRFKDGECHYPLYKDDFNILVSRVRSADGLVIGAPVHDGTIPWTVNAFWSRMLETGGMGSHTVGSAVTCALGREYGQENVLRIIKGFFNIWAGLSPSLDWTWDGFGCPLGVAGIQGWPFNVPSTSFESYTAVRHDIIAMRGAERLGKSLVDLIRIVKAGVEQLKKDKPDYGKPITPDDVPAESMHYWAYGPYGTKRNYLRLKAEGKI